MQKGWDVERMGRMNDPKGSTNILPHLMTILAVNDRYQNPEALLP